MNSATSRLRRYRDELFAHSSPTLMQPDDFDGSSSYSIVNDINKSGSSHSSGGSGVSNSLKIADNHLNSGNNVSNNSSYMSDVYSRDEDEDEDDDDSYGVSAIVSNLLTRQLATLKEIRYQQEIKDELIGTLKQRIYVLEQDQTCSNNIISQLKNEVSTLAHLLDSKVASEVGPRSDVSRNVEDLSNGSQTLKGGEVGADEEGQGEEGSGIGDGLEAHPVGRQLSGTSAQLNLHVNQCSGNDTSLEGNRKTNTNNQQKFKESVEAKLSMIENEAADSKASLEAKYRSLNAIYDRLSTVRDDIDTFLNSMHSQLCAANNNSSLLNDPLVANFETIQAQYEQFIEKIDKFSSEESSETNSPSAIQSKEKLFPDEIAVKNQEMRYNRVIETVISDLDVELRLMLTSIGNSSNHKIYGNIDVGEFISTNSGAGIEISTKGNSLLSKIDAVMRKCNISETPLFLERFLSTLKTFLESTLGDRGYTEELKDQISSQRESNDKISKLNETLNKKLAHSRRFTNYVKKVIPAHIQSMLSHGILKTGGGTDSLFNLSSNDISSVLPTHEEAKADGAVSKGYTDHLHSFQVFENGLKSLLEKYSNVLSESAKQQSLHNNNIQEITQHYEQQILSIKNSHKEKIEALSLSASNGITALSRASEIELKAQIKILKKEYDSKYNMKFKEVEKYLNEEKRKQQSIVVSMCRYLKCLMESYLVVQVRYQEILTERRFLSRLVREQDLLKRDIESVSKACLDNGNSDLYFVADNAVIIESQKAISDLKLNKAEYLNKLLSQSRFIPSIRIVALAILFANRLKVLHKFKHCTYHAPFVAMSETAATIVRSIEDWKLPNIGGSEYEGNALNPRNDEILSTLIDNLTIASTGQISSCILPLVSNRSTLTSNKGGFYGKNNIKSRSKQIYNNSSSVMPDRTQQRYIWSPQIAECIDLNGRFMFSKVRDALLSSTMACSHYSSKISALEKKFTSLTSALKAKLDNFEGVVMRQARIISDQAAEIEKYEKLQVCSTEYVIKLMKDTVVPGKKSDNNANISKHTRDNDEGNRNSTAAISSYAQTATKKDYQQAHFENVENVGGNTRLKTRIDSDNDSDKFIKSQNLAGNGVDGTSSTPMWIISGGDISATPSIVGEYRHIPSETYHTSESTRVRFEFPSRYPASNSDDDDTRRTRAAETVDLKAGNLDNDIGLSHDYSDDSFQIAQKIKNRQHTELDKYGIVDHSEGALAIGIERIDPISASSLIDSNSIHSLDDSLNLIEIYTEVSKLTESLRKTHGV